MLFPFYSRVATMDQLLANSLERRKVSTLLLAALASIALLLAAVCIYSVIAFVNQRIPEIRIRMALGAGRDL